MIRTYSELTRLATFQERFDYLKLNGAVGGETFGYDRWMNQLFYTSREWREFRDQIILRDKGCDLGIEGDEIGGIIVIHHMNPITIRDVQERNPDILNPNYVVCCSDRTHKAIHYGDQTFLTVRQGAERKPNDTCPWRKE